MNRLRVEVEPLSDERWTKIERSLLARLPVPEQEPALQRPARGRRLGVWLAAAATVVACAVALTWPWSSEPVAFDQPTRVTTGETPSHLALPGLGLDVEPESAVVVGADTPNGLLLVLDRGSIACRVAKRDRRDPVIVQAGAASVKVVGTHFSVTRLGESARVVVYEGVVEVTFEGKVTRVTAGREWPNPETSAMLAGDSPAELVPHGETPSVGGRAGREASALESAADRSEPRRSGRSAAHGVVLTPDDADEAARGTDEDSEETPSEPREEPPSAQAVFERATALEQSDPARASQLYATLSGRDAWSQNALYARARLEASRGNRDLARRLSERYLERFPRGSNAEDARAMLRRLR